MRLALAAALLLLPPCEGTTPEPTPPVEAPAPAPPPPPPVDQREAWEDAAGAWNAVVAPDRWVALAWPRFFAAGSVWTVIVGEPGPGLAGWTDEASHTVIVADFTDPLVARSVAAHELGHALCLRWDHLATVGSVMSNDGPWVDVLTAEDVAWCPAAPSIAPASYAPRSEALPLR